MANEDDTVRLWLEDRLAQDHELNSRLVAQFQAFSDEHGGDISLFARVVGAGLDGCVILSIPTRLDHEQLHRRHSVAQSEVF